MCYTCRDLRLRLAHGMPIVRVEGLCRGRRFREFRVEKVMHEHSGYSIASLGTV